MGVSSNGGTLKWMVYKGKNQLKWMIWGYPFSENLHMENPLWIHRLFFLKVFPYGFLFFYHGNPIMVPSSTFGHPWCHQWLKICGCTDFYMAASHQTSPKIESVMKIESVFDLQEVKKIIESMSQWPHVTFNRVTSCRFQQLKRLPGPGLHLTFKIF